MVYPRRNPAPVWCGTDGGLGFASKYRMFFRTRDLTAPEPAKMFVFLDGRQDQLIYPGFLTDMAGYPNQPSSYAMLDYPNMVHNLGASFSFADGRAEIHRWHDPRTTPPIYQIPPAPTASPRNLDVVWLQDHATRPK